MVPCTVTCFGVPRFSFNLEAAGLIPHHWIARAMRVSCAVMEVESAYPSTLRKDSVRDRRLSRRPVEALGKDKFSHVSQLFGQWTGLG